MTERTDLVQLHMKNRDRMAELEQHLDNAQRLYHEIAQPVYSKTITYSPQSFFGINGSDIAVIETEVKMLAAKIRQWGCIEDKLFHDTTFCSADNGFVQGEHSVCDPQNGGTKGECLQGDYERQNKTDLANWLAKEGNHFGQK
jgi:hypothetical protein